MNRPPPSTSREHAIPDELLRSRHFSPRQLRLLRKEILLLRSDLERAELVQASAELRYKVSHFGWLKWLAPGWAFGRQELSGLSTLMKKYPLLSSVVSLVVSGPVRRAANRYAGPAAKLGGMALAGWSIWKIWQSIQTPDNTEAADAEGQST